MKQNDDQTGFPEVTGKNERQTGKKKNMDVYVKKLPLEESTEL